MRVGEGDDKLQRAANDSLLPVADGGQTKTSQLLHSEPTMCVEFHRLAKSGGRVAVARRS